MGIGKVVEGITPKYDTQALADAARSRSSVEVPPPKQRADPAPLTNLRPRLNSVGTLQSLHSTAIVVFDITTFRVLFRHVPCSTPGNCWPTTMSDPWSTRGW